MELETLTNAVPNTAKWLIFEVGKHPLPPDQINEFMVRLNEDGLSILRSNTGLVSLHPQIGSVNYRWKRKEVNEAIPLNKFVVETNIYEYKDGIVTELFWAHGLKSQEEHKNSPFNDVFKGLVVRRRFHATETKFEFSIYKDLHELGVTDYLAFPIGDSGSMSVATTKPKGFNELEIEIIIVLATMLMPYLKSYQERQITKTLLTTYLGKKTGDRVLEGKIRRGDVEKIEAAIWFSDLRGFTRLSNQIESEELIQLLNEYFDKIATVIAQYEGEILKFIGDAVLVVFPVTKSSTSKDVCHYALQAAKKASSELEILNHSHSKQQLPLLTHSVGLHIGVVQYGNIGALNRLDFTVIGQSVNLASRIEGLCGKLGKQTLTSEPFANYMKEKLTFIGEYKLEGFTKNQKIFLLK